MKLRFKVNQAECLKRGIDAPKSIVTIEVNPAELSQQHRDLIADRMDGIDVAELWDSNGEVAKLQIAATGKVSLIEANSPDYEGLMEAIQANEAEVQQSVKRHRAVKLAIANAPDADVLLDAVNHKDRNRRPNADTGAHLNELWKIGARQARFRKTGDFYMPLDEFPGALCDPNGYVLFRTEAEYQNCPSLRIGIRLTVPNGISSIPSYVLKFPAQ